jgi:hypothetical protein
MPYILAGKNLPTPNRKVKCMFCGLYAWCVINPLMLFTVDDYNHLANKGDEGNQIQGPLFTATIVLQALTLLIQTISAIILFDALRRINNALEPYRFSIEHHLRLRNGTMWVHVISYTLFLVS